VTLLSFIVAWNFDKSLPRESASPGNLFAEFRETFHVPSAARRGAVVTLKV
jgi:hypothetical protein